MLAPRSWPEAVMHVLAHVEPTAHLPASVFDGVYVRAAAARLGPAGARPLGEDVAVLGRVLATHEALARAQLLAWLFDEAEQAHACADRDLGALSPAEVARPELLPEVAGAAVEVLRCAALLESEALADWPLPVEEDAGLAAALAEVAAAAPALARHALLGVRALRLRGRVRGEEIWIGMPCRELELGCEHVAWQAAHEATVHEIGAPLMEREVEAVAVVLLASRARDAGLGAAHARWLAHFAPAPSTDPASLGAEARRAFERLR